VYDAKSSNTPLYTISVHSFPVIALEYNERYDVVVSADEKGMLEYWSPETREFPKNVDFEMKSDTDLFEFAKNRTTPNHITFSPDDEMFASMSQDRLVRVFRFRTGKLHRKYDETIQTTAEMQQGGTASVILDDVEFNRRLAVEKDLEKSEHKSLANVCFDDSSNFILYATLLGVKVVNIKTNKVARILGKSENNQRFLNIALYQGIPKSKALVTLVSFLLHSS